MATLRDPQLIFTKMKTGKYKYYKVFDADGKTVIDQQNDADVTEDEAAQALQQTLETLDGLVHVTISQKNGKDTAAGGDVKNGQLKFTLKVGSGVDVKQTAVNGPAMPTGGLFEMLMAQIAENNKLQLQAIKNEYEQREVLRNMQQSINGPDNDPMNKIIDQLLPVMISHMQNNGSPVALAGVEPQPTQPIQMTPEQKTQLNESIHILMQKDPDFINNLAKLAKLANEKPATYQMAIGYLKTA